MQQTTITFPDELLRRAKHKADEEGVSLPEVLQKLLLQWVGTKTVPSKETRADKVERARRSHGMWRDRDPDDFLRRSRAGLKSRDFERLQGLVSVEFYSNQAAG